jgi:hypothetical protein
MSLPDFPDPLDPLRRELGALSIELSHVETYLGCAVGYLANPKEPRIGHILVSPLSFRARADAFCALYAERLSGEDIQEQLRAFRSELQQTEEARNTLIHSLYWSGPVGKTTATRIKTTVKPKHGLKLQFEDVTPQFVAEKTRALKKSTDTLDQLMLDRFSDFSDYTALFYGFFHTTNAA